LADARWGALRAALRLDLLTGRITAKTLEDGMPAERSAAVPASVGPGRETAPGLKPQPLSEPSGGHGAS
jgi:hypothetical protein